MRKTVKLMLSIALLVLLIGGGLLFFHAKNNTLTLKGQATVTLGLYGQYKEPGAKVLSNGQDVSDQVKITGKPDTAKPGNYVIRYSYQFMTAERTVTVTAQMNPKLTLDSDTLTLKLGQPYDNCTFTAQDDRGKDLSDRVKISNTNFKRAGKYQVSYKVTDDQGRTTQIHRQVRIEPNTDYKTPGIPICMYHYVYDEAKPPADLHHRYDNYISMTGLSEEIDYLKENNYYFPTWQEVRDYIDGTLLLPEKSIVLTFDDGEKSFLTNGIKVLEEKQTPATSFLITINKGKEKAAQYKSKYVTYQSHSHNMHRGGGTIGHGGILTALSEQEILTDLQTSQKACGNKDAFAYPFGDYNQAARDTIQKAGFLCAVTTQPGKVRPGDDPYLLNRVRMVQGQTLQSFINRIR